MTTPSAFTQPLLAWFDKHGRKDLPWQHPRTPYRVWVSEIMLQQTQVKTVIPYFLKFMQHFPDLNTLANASENDVLAQWSGLGYYSRARNLHKTATIIHTEFNGQVPSEIEPLLTLPGIGLSTAAAIASLAFDKPTPILDGNVKRVLSRYFLIGGEKTPAATEQELWQRATECMSSVRPADYTQAIMDLGATCCTTKTPDCLHCPLEATCLAKQHQVVNDYPIKKQKKSIPTKQEQFLLIHTLDGRIYLEKRASTGLWGGLWCLPSIDINACPKHYVQTTYNLQPMADPEALLSIKHSFSHFHLHIQARSIAIPNTIDALPEEGRLFLEKDMSTLGLAKPVSDILQHFFALGK